TYSVSTMHEDLKIPANYNFIPGFLFRERASRPSLGLITGRILAEEGDPVQALQGLQKLSDIYPGAFYIPFFQGLLCLRMNEQDQALLKFRQALDIQPAQPYRPVGRRCDYCNGAVGDVSCHPPQPERDHRTGAAIHDRNRVYAPAISDSWQDA
ncbi:MAG: tetratricopeptide repeat protein, partial [Armatimonadota bacterium]